MQHTQNIFNKYFFSFSVTFKFLFISNENAGVISSKDDEISVTYVTLIQYFSKCGPSDQQQQHYLETC